MLHSLNIFCVNKWIYLSIIIYRNCKGSKKKIKQRVHIYQSAISSLILCFALRSCTNRYRSIVALYAFTFLWYGRFVYLKAGTGKACAGHMRVSDRSQWTVYVREFSVIGNFGFVLATGSIRKRKKGRAYNANLQSHYRNCEGSAFKI